MYAAKAAAASLTPGGSPGNTYHEKSRMDLQLNTLIRPEKSYVQ